MSETLPPLPPTEWLGQDPFEGDIRAYTADQMRSYAAAVLAQREPLTADAVRALLKKAGYLQGFPESASHFINGIRYAEQAHGITKDKT